MKTIIVGGDHRCGVCEVDTPRDNLVTKVLILPDRIVQMRRCRKGCHKVEQQKTVPSTASLDLIEEPQ